MTSAIGGRPVLGETGASRVWSSLIRPVSPVGLRPDLSANAVAQAWRYAS